MNQPPPLEVWIVDDDASIRWVLERALKQAGLSPITFEDADSAMAALRRGEPDVLVTDIRMPGKSGLDLLEDVRARKPKLPVIVMTAHSDLDSAVAAYQGGAFEYLPKPFDIDQAVELVRRAATQQHAVESASESRRIPEMLGHAPAMQEMFRAIGRLSRSSMTVLITGESGTGKELVARALHRHSPRATKPFIALNTSAFTADLLESELFGHEKGAFTGANELRRGRFEQADGGTLFLDEIGDMPASLQTRLLRVLAEGEFFRVGGRELIRVDVRVIAATHQDLEARVREGAFRADLLHRLDVVRLHLPPLRERRGDVGLLAARFLAEAARRLGGKAKRLQPEALRRLEQHDWPGNVRELENLCWRLAALAPGDSIGLKDLRALFRPSAAAAAEDWSLALAASAREALARAEPGLHARLRERFDQVLLEAALEHTGGHRQNAAQALGLGRNTLTRKLGARTRKQP
jgi:two-component system nitrogen regulation response regulator GlnG